MTGRWYAPDEPWPEHDKQWWADSLREARAAGWHLRTFTGHTWGKVVCDRDAPDAHAMLIFSTGRGGENAARQLQKLIARCEHHRSGVDPGDDLECANRLLTGASQLLDAVELLLLAADKRIQAEELLRLAEQELSRIERSDALLDAATRLDSESTEAAAQAVDLTAAAGYSPKRPHTEAGITDEAEHRVDQAERSTTAASVAQHVRALRHRIVAIRTRMP